MDKNNQPAQTLPTGQKMVSLLHIHLFNRRTSWCRLLNLLKSKQMMRRRRTDNVSDNATLMPITRTTQCYDSQCSIIHTEVAVRLMLINLTAISTGFWGKWGEEGRKGLLGWKLLQTHAEKCFFFFFLPICFFFFFKSGHNLKYQYRWKIPDHAEIFHHQCSYHWLPDVC